MNYIENPKTRGSGIVCCIPQTGRCPNECEDCFFQSGRSYLEPLDENLPNIPPDNLVHGRVVRVNDGNDSDHARDFVLRRTARYPMRFYNTAHAADLAGYGAPVVLTVNPGDTTDHTFATCGWQLPLPNLMFIRIRTNTWNLDLVQYAAEHYTTRNVPVVLTFMAYFRQAIPDIDRKSYVYRKRTLNSYWAITTRAWRDVMSRFEDNPLVYSCGKIEGERGTTACARCGNCLREYFATVERMKA